MFYIIFIILFGVNFLSCETCSGRRCDKVSMPMVNYVKAKLKVKLDITEMNRRIRAYIEEKVNKSIASAVQSTINILKTRMDRPDVKNVTNDLNIRDCSDIKEKKDGVYHIYPEGNPGYKVYCDMTTDGGGWTVFQRRFYGGEQFHDKLWIDYKNGFGRVDAEYWLGNDKLYQLTANGTYTLRVNLSDWYGYSYYAVYENFKIDDSESGYKLHIGKYHGSAGNSLKTNNGEKFSTSDKNNGHPDFNCASYDGGWWWCSQLLYDCGESQLNSRYLDPNYYKKFNPEDVVMWGSVDMKKTQMMIRRE